MGVKASPSARTLAKDHDLDLSLVEGTGKGGFITKADVEAALNAMPPASSEGGDEPAEESAEDQGPLVEITLSARAPFAAIDLPGSDPSVVLRRGESALVPQSVAEATERAFEVGALPERLQGYVTATETGEE